MGCSTGCCCVSNVCCCFCGDGGSDVRCCHGGGLAESSWSDPCCHSCSTGASTTTAKAYIRQRKAVSKDIKTSRGTGKVGGVLCTKTCCSTKSQQGQETIHARIPPQTCDEATSGTRRALLNKGMRFSFQPARRRRNLCDMCY